MPGIVIGVFGVTLLVLGVVAYVVETAFGEGSAWQTGFWISGFAFLTVGIWLNVGQLHPRAIRALTGLYFVMGTYGFVLGIELVYRVTDRFRITDELGNVQVILEYGERAIGAYLLPLTFILPIFAAAVLWKGDRWRIWGPAIAACTSLVGFLSILFLAAPRFELQWVLPYFILPILTLAILALPSTRGYYGKSLPVGAKRAGG